MPLSKVKQAQWMREYRGKKKRIGITTKILRDIAKPVIPKPYNRPEIDADGNQIPEFT